MANCGDGLRSKPSNGSIDRGKDILCGAAGGLNGHFQADAAVGPTVRETR